jgi:exodeoxyribonuclease-3
MRLISWNVAGLRAALRKGALDFSLNSDYDVICLQETKANREEVAGLEPFLEVYPHQYWNSTKGTTQRKGLSGTAIWSKEAAVREIPPPDFDEEGRTTCLEFERFILLTVYTPNSQMRRSERARFRSEVWDLAFRSHVRELMRCKPVLVCGDLNVAHKDIDVYHPEKWADTSGLLDEERSGLDTLLALGLVDTLRAFNKKPRMYTYWPFTVPVFRPRNIGWRIDYFLADRRLMPHITRPQVLREVVGSDHCPVTVDLDFSKRHRRLVIAPSLNHGVSAEVAALSHEALQDAFWGKRVAPGHIDAYNRMEKEVEVASLPATL